MLSIVDKRRINNREGFISLDEEIEDKFGRKVRLTKERKEHLEGDHPEMRDSKEII